MNEIIIHIGIITLVIGGEDGVVTVITRGVGKDREPIKMTPDQMVSLCRRIRNGEVSLKN